MYMRAVLIAGAGLMLGATAWSQSAKPDAPKAEAAKADAAEAAAAMERAQRMAANPMRVILQASKMRRRAGEPEPAVDVSRLPLRQAAAGSAAAAVVGSVTAAVVTTASAATANLEPPAQQTAPPAAPSVASLLLSAAPAAPAMPEAAPLERVGSAPTVGVVAQPVPAPALMPSLAVQPRLAKMIEPEIPPRLRAENQRVSEVLADLTLRADGSVAAVALLPPIPRSWQRYLVAALEQWRFDSLPAGQVHRVQLVFDAP